MIPVEGKTSTKGFYLFSALSTIQFLKWGNWNKQKIGGTTGAVFLLEPLSESTAGNSSIPIIVSSETCGMRHLLKNDQNTVSCPSELM
jgi:hypothetical protein